MSEQQDGFREMLWRWRERWRALWKTNAPLREFVYLDETSVYSLYASRFGEIPSERTDTLTQIRQREVGGSFSPATGGAKSGLTARALSAQMRESQVVSRAIVQSTFKDLLEKERKTLSLKHVPDFEKTPHMENLNSLRARDRNNRRLKKLRKKGFVVDADTLTRGALLEIEVELNSEFIFQFSSVVQALVGMVSKSPAMFGHDEEEITELSNISAIIEELLVGLIPLRGRAVEYSVVVFDSPEDGKLVVHNKLLENLEDGSGFTTRPLFVVGVAEEALFWKDIRRVLFAGQRFQLLCRVARDDVGTSWVPLKLQQVVSSMFPELGEEIEKVNRGDLFEAELDGIMEWIPTQERYVRDALRAHARRLAELKDVSLSDDDLDSIDALASERLSAFETTQDQRAAFKKVEDHMSKQLNIKVEDAETVESSRQRAREDAGTAKLATSSSTSKSDTEISTAPDDEYFLDSEFVAIYW